MKTKIPFNFRSTKSTFMAAAFAGCMAATPAHAGQPLLLAQADLTTFNIEELMDITVTSVSKKAQKIGDAAAAIYVITQDDIRRSGVTSIADALRMAPGVQVARIDSNKWAVSSRGFNGRFANKLLVLMDGRSLYTPYFLGVYWELQDTVLEDIDRIEIIRGPGAALWGANAVNGVINIITKSADKTVGALVSTGAGSHETAFATARYGASIGNDTHLKFYVKHNERDGFVDAFGQGANDAWHKTQGGFRLDSQLTTMDNLTLQGDFYDGEVKETFVQYDYPASANPFPYKIHKVNSDMHGGNILARWKREFSDSHNLSFQLYYDHTDRNMFVSPQKFDIIDLDFQHQFSLGSSQNLVYGFGYRNNAYEITNTTTLTFSQQNVRNNLYSFFLHDEITLIPSTLSMIIGSRFENNDYSGFDAQPNGRLLWNISPRNSAWAAVSRAVRSSTQGEQDINYRYRTIPAPTPQNQNDPLLSEIHQLPPQGIPYRLEILGNKNFKSEELMAYEIGYRTEPLPALSFDIAAYYNSYKKLRVVTAGTGHLDASTSPATYVLPYYLSNDMHGHSIGVELSADWKPCDWWRLQASYSYQNFAMFLDGTSTDQANKGAAEGGGPQHQFSIRSGLDLGSQVTLDTWLRGAGQLTGVNQKSIPGYVTMDARLAWKPVKQLELSLVGQNLFTSHHAEFVPEYVFTIPSEIERSVYGKLTWNY
jgi:iron complex outermembrane receptor protein